jgi:hypothetical protein
MLTKNTPTRKKGSIVSVIVLSIAHKKLKLESLLNFKEN